MSNHKNTTLINKIQKEYDEHKKLGIKMNKCEVARKLNDERKKGEKIITRQAINYHMRKNVRK